MGSDLSIFHLVASASFLVKLVLLLLLGASVVSWAIMIRKWRQLREVTAAADFFEQRFWSGIDLQRLHRSLGDDNHLPGSVEEVFLSGYRGFQHLYDEPDVSAAAALESAQRGMRAGLNRAIEALEENIAILATVGSTSPYVGLFGTVWGIMSAFQALADVKQATLQMVAPGIAEALIATAMGLFAAIPAVVAYNRLAHRVDRLGGRYEAFAEEFMGILQRQASRHDSSKKNGKELGVSKK